MTFYDAAPSTLPQASIVTDMPDIFCILAACDNIHNQMKNRLWQAYSEVNCCNYIKETSILAYNIFFNLQQWFTNISKMQTIFK